MVTTFISVNFYFCNFYRANRVVAVESLILSKSPGYKNNLVGYKDCLSKLDFPPNRKHRPTQIQMIKIVLDSNLQKSSYQFNLYSNCNNSNRSNRPQGSQGRFNLNFLSQLNNNATSVYFVLIVSPFRCSFILQNILHF